MKIAFRSASPISEVAGPPYREMKYIFRAALRSIFPGMIIACPLKKNGVSRACRSVTEIFYIFARVSPKLKLAHGPCVVLGDRYIAVLVAISVDVNTDGGLTLRLWFPTIFFIYTSHTYINSAEQT